jgi:hypothetical protein
VQVYIANKSHGISDAVSHGLAGQRNVAGVCRLRKLVVPLLEFVVFCSHIHRYASSKDAKLVRLHNGQHELLGGNQPMLIVPTPSSGHRISPMKSCSVIFIANQKLTVVLANPFSRPDFSQQCERTREWTDADDAVAVIC